MFRKILVPLDGSEFAERAVETARSLAARLNAGVEFVTVHQPEIPPSRVGGASQGAPPGTPRVEAHPCGSSF